MTTESQAERKARLKAARNRRAYARRTGQGQQVEFDTAKREGELLAACSTRVDPLVAKTKARLLALTEARLENALTSDPPASGLEVKQLADAVAELSKDLGLSHPELRIGGSQARVQHADKSAAEIIHAARLEWDAILAEQKKAVN
jgi:hypothetical protein